MKYLLVLASVMAVVTGQRPTYAGISPKGYPELASRFRDPDQDANAENAVAVGNRIGADEDQLSTNLPVDARGDAVLVNRLNQWPRENQPFWLVNSQHIDRHRHPNENVNQQQQDLNNVQGSQQRLNEIQPGLSDNQSGANREQPLFGTDQQIQPNVSGNRQGLNGEQQIFGTNQELQPNLGGQQGLNREQPTFGINQEFRPRVSGNQQGLNREQQTFGINQQGLNREQAIGANQRIQPSSNGNQQGLNTEQQTLGFNQQPVRDQSGRVQSRFGEPVATETRTIKPLSQRGSFAG